MPSLVPKTNSVAGSATAPNAGLLAQGELAENKFTGRLYMKTESDSVVDPARVVLTGAVTGTTSTATSEAQAGTIVTTLSTVAVSKGGTGATTAPLARAALGAAASGVNSDITSIGLTTGTISTTPSSGDDIVNKTYADAIASGINFHDACDYATITDLSPVALYQGTAGSGVNAKLTGSTNGALVVDGVTVAAGKRILVKNQTTSYQNGVYTVTQQGTGSLPYILTRATDYDTSGSGTNEVQAGDFILVLGGNTLANTAWVQQTQGTIVWGTTSIVFAQFAAASGVATFSGGTTGLTPSTPTNGAVVLGGTLDIDNGGTGATTAAAAITALTGTQTAGRYLRSDGSNASLSAIQAGDIPLLNQSTTGTASKSNNLTGGSSTTLLGSIPYQSNTDVTTLLAPNTTVTKKFLRQTGNGTNGAAPAWDTIAAADVPILNQNTTGTAGGVSGVVSIGNGGTSASSPSQALSNLGAAKAADVQVYLWDLPNQSGMGAWVKPTGAKIVNIQLFGAGGGGGGGNKNTAASTVKTGGGGGGGGSFLNITVLADALDSYVNYSVGVGGSGGSGQSIVGNGLTGSAGGPTTFGPFYCPGGTGGNGGSASAATAGIGILNAHSGGASSTSAAGNAGSPSGVTSISLNGGAGGGAGGSVTSAGAVTAGGTGGRSTVLNQLGGTSGAAGAAGGNGYSNLISALFAAGSGGGGGGGGLAVAGGAGGAGGFPAGGGGGGGGTETGTKAGDGGGGNGGLAIITTYF